MTASDLFSSFPHLQTDRLLLRQMMSGDAEDLYAFYADPQISKFLDWKGPASVEESRQLIESWNESFQQKRLIPWGISMKSQRQLIGTVMFMPIRGTFDEVPLFPLTVGFELDRRQWNKGIMSEALQAVLSFGRERIGSHRIQAEVMPDNAASLKVLKKLGFVEEGLLKQYLIHEVTKTFLDVIVLALLS